VFTFLLNFLNSLIFIIFAIGLIVFFNLIIYYLKNRKYIKTSNNLSDPNEISIDDLKELPLINIVVPAWKEGQLFKNCLLSIKQLNYPNIRIIVNAGGNEETINIANEFKKYDNFLILRQKCGADRPSLGKVRALNECLDHISEGIVYFIDADSYLNNEILLRMIFPIVNYNEDIIAGGVRPLEFQERKRLVKYVVIDRYRLRTKVFKRKGSPISITGQNICMKYDVIKSIGKFSEHRKIATDVSMGEDLLAKGYLTYQLVDYRHRIYVDYSSTIKEYINQRTIWVENFLIYNYKFRKLTLIKFVLLFLADLYLFVFPFMFFLNFGLFMIGILIIFHKYLKEIRKFLVFTKTTPKKNRQNINFAFFFTFIFFIYIEAIITIRIPFHFLSFLKRLKSNKVK